MHAQIVVHGDDYFLRDLNSRNGTWVNGKAVKEIQLSDGDVVSFGSSAFSFTFTLEGDEMPGSKKPERGEWRRKNRPDSGSPGAASILGNIKKTFPRTYCLFPLTSPTPIKKYPNPRISPIGSRLTIEPQSATLITQPGDQNRLGGPGAGGNSVLSIVGIAPALAYDAGYKYGLEGICRPSPRFKLSHDPEVCRARTAFRMDIKQSYYDDFVNGMNDACF